MVESREIEKNEKIERLLVTKKMRSMSGVSIITILTKDYPCPGKCIYCPQEKGVPKSYLSNEPAVMRAILNEYDPARQVLSRIESLKKQGHPVDKVELIVIGGTFSCLPHDYQESYIKACLDAMNGFESKALDEAKTANEKAEHRCVGLTLETRPDYINEKEVEWFRYLGATRVELGVQALDDKILAINLRGHKVSETINATRLLKDAGFKVCWHLMPNLYGSNVEKDKKMFREVFSNPDFRPDYIKIYPCMVIKGAPLYDLWKEGKYTSYSNEELLEVIKNIKSHVPYWVRILRTIRDIPSVSIESGSKTSNLRQVVQREMKMENLSCKCIRCREVGSANKNNIDGKDKKLFVEEYESSGGKEIFLSFESADRKVIYSLLRLRLTSNQFLYEIKDCALIREVHTYGQQAEIGEEGDTQHRGMGKKLILEAERIVKENGFRKIAVISGIGVRDYYRKQNYKLIGEYMVKELV